MISKLIDVGLKFLWLLMFKIFGIIGVPKIEFFNFSGTERVKQSNKKNILNPLSLPATHYVGHNTNLPSNSDISKTVGVNMALKGVFF